MQALTLFKQCTANGLLAQYVLEDNEDGETFFISCQYKLTTNMSLQLAKTDKSCVVNDTSLNLKSDFKITDPKVIVPTTPTVDVLTSVTPVAMNLTDVVSVVLDPIIDNSTEKTLPLLKIVTST